MPRPNMYTIGPESVADYLQDIEKRWGVKVAIVLEWEHANDMTPQLRATVGMPFPQHQREIPWAGRLEGSLRDANRASVLFQIWDMLYEYDRIIERGPQRT